MASINSLPPPQLNIFSEEEILKGCLKKIVKKLNDANLTIYIYTGDEKKEPIRLEEKILFNRMVNQIGLNCSVIEVSDFEFHRLKWNPKCSILYIPGANASALDLHIGSKIQEIKDFVMQGGRFLGWSGSGYWACREVHYQLNERNTVHKIRSLAFWQGIEKGPLLPSLKNTQGDIEFFQGTVPIEWAGSSTLRKYLPNGLKLNVLISGGGSFVPHQQEHPYKLLASYCNVEANKALAGVKTYVGNGIAILMNPYFTYGSEYLESGLSAFKNHFPEHQWEKIVTSLKNDTLKNRLCFADMLYEFISPKNS